MPAGSKVPRVMLTTKERPNNSESERPQFNSLTYHGPIAEGEWAVKIFSEDRISDEWLDNMFHGQVKWVTRKEVSRHHSSLYSSLISVIVVGSLSRPSPYY